MEHTCVSFESDEQKLTDIFDEALELYERITKSDSPTSCPKLQAEIKYCISILERCTKLINVAGVFSSNETFDEIPTPNIKYLLIPGLLGKLVVNSQVTERLNALETAEVYFKDFLKRIQDYEVLTDLNLKELEETEEDLYSKKLDLQQLAMQRNEKIRKYNEQKAREAEISRLKSLKIGDDSEISRSYYTTYIKSMATISLDELNSIKQEKPLAKHLVENRSSGTFSQLKAKEENIKIKPFKPVIIIRNELQKKVFGAGYPSLPTMTVEEFYKERVEEGIFPAHSSNHGKVLQEMTDPEVVKRQEENEEVRKENEIETDDPEYLRTTRGMDEYKDTHKRGWGNRLNRS